MAEQAAGDVRSLALSRRDPAAGCCGIGVATSRTTSRKGDRSRARPALLMCPWRGRGHHRGRAGRRGRDRVIERPCPCAARDDRGRFPCRAVSGNLGTDRGSCPCQARLGAGSRPWEPMGTGTARRWPGLAQGSPMASVFRGRAGASARRWPGLRWARAAGDSWAAPHRAAGPELSQRYRFGCWRAARRSCMRRFTSLTLTSSTVPSCTSCRRRDTSEAHAAEISSSEVTGRGSLSGDAMVPVYTLPVSSPMVSSAPFVSAVRLSSWPQGQPWSRALQ